MPLNRPNSDGGLVDSIDNPAGLFEYSYDANKNRTAEQITGPLSAASWTTGTTGFDDDDRLTYRNQGTGTLTEEWDLSLVGDWNSFTENGTSTARTHGPTHEIQTVGTASLTHDSKGNLTTDEKGQLLAWDFDNMLTSVDTDADTNLDVEYHYDALARRVARTEWNHTPMTPVSTKEVYAVGSHYSAEGEVFGRFGLERGASGPNSSAIWCLATRSCGLKGCTFRAGAAASVGPMLHGPCG